MIPFLAQLLGAGAIAGFVAGLLGVGGGTVTIPVLFVMLGSMDVPLEWRMHVCIATSLAIIIVTNLSSVKAHHKRGGVDWQVAKDWGFAIAVGAVAGSFFAKTLKTAELVYFFATLATFLAVKMILPLDKWKLGESLPGGIFRYLNPGIIGFFSSVMGIGGGSFSVPYLTLYSVPIHRAVGTASLVGIVLSFTAAMGYVLAGWGVEGLPSGMIGFIHWPSAVTVALSAVLFAPLGAKTAHKMPKRLLSIVFGLFLLGATAKLLSAV